jgi:hypothetical protein
MDECPKIILTVVCDSHRDGACCPTYAAEVAGQWDIPIERLRFKWFLTKGRIISGEGTSLIRFNTRRAKGKSVVVRVRVEGLDNWHPVCQREISLTIDKCKDIKRSATT